MKYIIAGGRSFYNTEVMDMVLSQFSDITEVVCGVANGADKLGEQWAIKNEIPVKYFAARWELYGKSAGYIRNADMSVYGEALIAFWDGQSKGTKNMIKIMKAIKKPYWVFNYQGELIENG